MYGDLACVVCACVCGLDAFDDVSTRRNTLGLGYTPPSPLASADPPLTSCVSLRPFVLSTAAGLAEVRYKTIQEARWSAEFTYQVQEYLYPQKREPHPSDRKVVLSCLVDDLQLTAVRSPPLMEFG